MNKYHKLLNIKWQDNGNAGDSVCSPCLYFDEFRGADIAHINHPWTVDHAGEYEAVIIGGGGLLNEENTPTIQRIIPKAKKVILWAIGTNSGAGFQVPDLRAENVVGWLRHENPFFPVGVCPSCLHPALDHTWPWRKRTTEGFLSHKDHLLEVPDGSQHLTNEAQMDEIAAFISRHEKIVTNTWHGAYFCHLLNTPFEIKSPWSSKFDFVNFEAFGSLRSHRALAQTMYSHALEFLG